MSMTWKGRPFKANTFAADIETTMINGIKEQLREQIVAIRLPSTGEFPTVNVHGDRLDDLRLSVEGSPELLALVKERLGTEEIDATFIEREPDAVPRAFLSYSFDDHDLARRIAEGLMAQGIDVWWAEWEMKAGDSLRQRIDEGLGNCTHFIVLLTPGSIQKPWVNQEMDAGLVRKISGQARFIALRSDLPARDLPPLLQGSLSPEISAASFDETLRSLVNDIHEVSRKPARGPAPETVTQPTTGYSPQASAVAKVFVERTGQALFGDPQLSVEKIAQVIEASEEDVEDALHELRDMVKVSFRRVLPKADLYATFDKFFMPWSPEDDALTIAAGLVNDDTHPHDTEQLAAHYGWDRRRMNPALAYLAARKLIVDYQVLSANGWYNIRVVKNDSTRRFVKSRS